MHVRYRQFRDSFARRDWLEWQDARCAEIAAGEKTMTEVAAQCGACEATVRQWMRKWREEQGGERAMSESWISGPPSPTRDQQQLASETLEQDTRARWRLAYAQYEDAMAQVHELEEFALWVGHDDDEGASALDSARIERQRAEVARAECNSCAAILGKSWEVV